MAIEDAIFNTITGALELVVKVVVRLFGFSEVKSKKIVAYIGWLLAFILVSFLLWLTLKYS
ncbi:MAG: hypothetical protein V4545_03515 [Pseudomonadota bacterium]